MSIQEQITALLNGELIDETRVAELMHVLAVSPEKRDVLIEQIRMSRAFSVLGAGIVPPHSADQRIWEGIDAIDRNLPPAPPVVPVARPLTLRQPAPLFGRMLRATVGSLLLVGVGITIGYFLRGDDDGAGLAEGGAVTTQQAATTPSDNTSLAILEAMRDSMSALRMQLDRIAARHPEASARDLSVARAAERSTIGQRTGAPGSVTNGRSGVIHTRALAPISRAEERSEVAPIMSVPLLAAGPSSAVLERSLARPALTSPKGSIEPLARGPEHSDYSGTERWQVGLRDNFRFMVDALPDTVHPEQSRSPLFDREIMASYRLSDPGEGLLSGIHLTAAVGQTQFAQTFPYSKDSNLHQTPVLMYARGILSREMVSLDDGNITGLVEVGTGGTAIGPIATLGFNMALKPAGRLNVHAGASAWMLWTAFQGDIYMNQNLNVHVGLTYGF